MNPLFNELNGGSSAGAAGLISQFQQFKSGFKGDPKEEVMKLVQSGRLSQAQLNMLQQRASMLQGILK